LTLIRLATWSDEHGHAYALKATLARSANVKPRQIAYNLRDLENLGEIHTKGRPGRSSQFLITVAGGLDEIADNLGQAMGYTSTQAKKIAATLIAAQAAAAADLALITEAEKQDWAIDGTSTSVTHDMGRDVTHDMGGDVTHDMGGCHPRHGGVSPMTPRSLSYTPLTIDEEEGESDLDLDRPLQRVSIPTRKNPEPAPEPQPQDLALAALQKLIDRPNGLLKARAATTKRSPGPEDWQTIQAWADHYLTQYEAGEITHQQASAFLWTAIRDNEPAPSTRETVDAASVAAEPVRIQAWSQWAEIGSAIA
jgi:hypothetical protein